MANINIIFWSSVLKGFPDNSVGKESTCTARDPSSIPGLGRSPGEGKGYPLQYSGLENSMDCTVHGVAKAGHDWATFTKAKEREENVGWELGFPKDGDLYPSTLLCIMHVCAVHLDDLVILWVFIEYGPSWDRDHSGCWTAMGNKTSQGPHPKVKETNKKFQGLPWWLSGKESTCQYRRHGFCTVKITHAVEQPSPRATTTEPVLWSLEPEITEPTCCSYWGLCTLEPAL